MAQGFGDIQRSAVKNDSGYETIFEKITALTGGEKKTYTWYKNAVRKEVNRFKLNSTPFFL